MYFKQSDFFSGMAHLFVKELMDGTEKATYEAGDLIFREGDPTRYFYILIKGHIKLTIGDEAHTVFVINRPGECFGWSSLVNRSSYSASAVCVAPTNLMRLDKSSFRATLEHHPVDGLLFMERVAGMIGDRLLQSYRTLASLMAMTAHPTEGTGQVQEVLELA